MSFELEDFFPNAAQGLSNIGFLFGAGASFKAGYPLMPKLTVEVIAKLAQGEVDLLDSLVERSLNKKIDKVNGDPDIEVISGWEVDHKKPVDKCGTDNPRNLQSLQTDENREKGNKYP